MNNSRLNFLLEHIKPGRILDVGNLDKNGYVHKILLEKMAGSEIHGLDIIDQATVGLDFSHQKIGSFENMAYPDDFFDAV